MAEIEIRYTVDLVLHVYDTVTGKSPPTKQFFCYRDGKLLQFVAKPDGYLVFTGLGRENCTISIESNAYLREYIEVDFSRLESRLPMILVHLIPKDKKSDLDLVYAVAGHDPGIKRLEGIRVGGYTLRIRQQDDRKRLLTVTNPYRVDLQHLYYAKPGERSYEAFEIVRDTGNSIYKLDHALAEGWRDGDPITRVFKGWVGHSGEYRLKFPNDNSEAKYMVRYELGGNEFFKIIEFKGFVSARLTEPVEEKSRSPDMGGGVPLR